ncbi:MAG TPA: lysophospholipid acyltransferase family protein [Edaphocola sp.]|nr:lysophospholipid acyltransferase family protein [Edaphocola sp.]
MYYLLFFITFLLSLLPLWCLYGLSRLCYLILFHILAYRKKIVFDNLRFAFPRKDARELNGLMRAFYGSFCDQWVETLKLMSLSPKKIKQRFPGNWAVFEQAARSGNGKVVVMMGHQFNWEWGNLATPLNFSGQYAGIYLPVSNKAVNRLMLYIRKRTGALLIPANDLREGFLKLNPDKHILAFIADQSPGDFRRASWHLFMNRPAAFLRGPEKVARRQQAAVVFVGLRKLKRGHYEIRAEQICENAEALPNGELLKHYIAFLEKELHRQPANWMWSHRRWKRAPPGENGH